MKRQKSKGKQPISVIILTIAFTVMLLFTVVCILGWMVNMEWLEDYAAKQILSIVRITVILGMAYYVSKVCGKNKVIISMVNGIGTIIVLLLCGMINGPVHFEMHTMVIPIGLIAVGLLAGMTKRRTR